MAVCCMQNCKGAPGQVVHGRGPSRIGAQLPSIPGIADAGLGLTEGALPGSADAEISSSDTAALSTSAAQKGKLAIREEYLPNSHIRLEVTVPQDFLKKAQQKAMKQLRADANIPGFRKGKKVGQASAHHCIHGSAKCSISLFLMQSVRCHVLTCAVKRQRQCSAGHLLCRFQTG